MLSYGRVTNRVYMTEWVIRPVVLFSLVACLDRQSSVWLVGFVLFVFSVSGPWVSVLPLRSGLDKLLLSPS